MARGGRSREDHRRWWFLPLCVCALLGRALGAVIRLTAGGIAATVAVILVPGILALLAWPAAALAAAAVLIARRAA